MTDNVYAAPLSNLDDVVETAANHSYYVVSVRKMLILFFMTLGFYLPYWFYKNWSLHRKATGDTVWPLPRAIFSVFFTHSLFRNIALHDVTGKREHWDSEGPAAGMVLAMIALRIFDHLSTKNVGSPFTDVLALLMLLPIAMLLKRVQTEINARCGDPAGSSNNQFSTANIAWCAVGGTIWVLEIVGLILPPA